MKVLLYTFLFVVTSADAALNRVSHHSRANCFGFNESVSWDGNHNHNWSVSSFHFKKDMQHLLSEPKMRSHRCAAYHATEAYKFDKWKVQGIHLMYDWDWNFTKGYITYATDCNKWDGWFLKKSSNPTVSQKSTEITFKNEAEAQEYIKNNILHGLTPGKAYVLSNAKIASFNHDNKTATIVKNDNDEDEDIDTLKGNLKEDVEKELHKTNGEVKKLISEIKMAYKFKGIPQDIDLESLAYVPFITYIQDKGWVGATQYFIAANIGNCLLEESSFKFNNMIISVPENKAQYLINNKLTNMEVSGNVMKGFIYDLSWYDSELARTLKCYNKDFNTKIKDKVIELAKRIDR